MKILIIDSDKDIVFILRSALSSRYIVELASSAEEGEYYSSLNCFDVIIIDMILPDANGIDVCRNLRNCKNTTPILMIAGDSSVEKKLMAFENGADDYLTVPFETREFQARVHALLRRSRTLNSENISLHDLTINITTKTVFRNESPINLRRKEYLILEYLLRNVGKVMTRETILNHVWGMSQETSGNVVDVHIKYLRDRVDRQFDKKLIKTVHGLGYKIEA
jgi:DNA-binding response OmpR family regulator